LAMVVVGFLIEVPFGQNRPISNAEPRSWHKSRVSLGLSEEKDRSLPDGVITLGQVNTPPQTCHYARQRQQTTTPGTIGFSCAPGIVPGLF
jgi:hypothetical protein